MPGRWGWGSYCLLEIRPHPRPPNPLAGVLDRAGGELE